MRERFVIPLRYSLIGWFLDMSWPGIEPATLAPGGDIPTELPGQGKPPSYLAWMATTVLPSFYFCLPLTQVILHAAVNVSLLYKTLQMFNKKSPFLDIVLYALAPAYLPTSSWFSFLGWLFWSHWFSFSSLTHPKLTFFRASAQTALDTECLCCLFPRLSPLSLNSNPISSPQKNFPWQLHLMELIFSLPAPCFCPSNYFNLQLSVFSTNNKLYGATGLSCLVHYFTPQASKQAWHILGTQSSTHYLPSELNGQILQGGPWTAYRLQFP